MDDIDPLESKVKSEDYLESKYNIPEVMIKEENSEYNVNDSNENLLCLSDSKELVEKYEEKFEEWGENEQWGDELFLPDTKAVTKVSIGLKSEKPMLCLKCTNYFATKEELENHTKSVHDPSSVNKLENEKSTVQEGRVYESRER